MEIYGDEIYIPTFSACLTTDRKITYVRDSLIDIPERAARNAARALADSEEESEWRVIVLFCDGSYDDESEE